MAEAHGLSAEQFRARSFLWWHACTPHNQGTLPADDVSLARLSGLETFSTQRAEILGNFGPGLEPGRLAHSHLVYLYSQTTKKSKDAKHAAELRHRSTPLDTAPTVLHLAPEPARRVDLFTQHRADPPPAVRPQCSRNATSTGVNTVGGILKNQLLVPGGVGGRDYLDDWKVAARVLEKFGWSIPEIAAAEQIRKGTAADDLAVVRLIANAIYIQRKPPRCSKIAYLRSMHGGPADMDRDAAAALIEQTRDQMLPTPAGHVGTGDPR